MTDTSARATTAFTVSPDDAALALRMGWILAELRGRLDPACTYTAEQGVRPAPTLVLETAQERDAVEGQVEATKVLSALGGLDPMKIDIATLSRHRHWGDQAPAGRPALKTPDMLRSLVYRLICTRHPRGSHFEDLNATLRTKRIEDADYQLGPDGWWYRVQWFLWAWDEALQDQLAAGKFGTASSYELGRGLSECYWGATNSRFSEELREQWSFVLGENRVKALRDLSLRLAPVFNPYTAPAVIASLDAWEAVWNDALRSGEWRTRQQSAADCKKYLAAMQEQARIWRDLLVTGRDPLTLVTPSKLETVARDPRPILKAFWWELVAAAVLATGLALTLTYASSWARGALAALATVGLTASAIVSWIKSRAQSVATRVGAAVNQSVVNEAVNQAATLVEPKAGRARLLDPLLRRSS
jgi:hypothetical protein